MIKCVYKSRCRSVTSSVCLWPLLWINMKLLIATIFVVLTINQIQAFPELADKDGIHIDIEKREDSTPAHQALLNYAKLLAEISDFPSQVGPAMNSPATNKEIAEDQTTPLCPTPNCTCNVTLLTAHGFIRDSDGRPTDNCTVYNVPYCEGVCSSSYRYECYWLCGNDHSLCLYYRYQPVRADTQPILLERHQCCHATSTSRRTFFTLCIPFYGGNAYLMRYRMIVPAGCECRICST